MIFLDRFSGPVLSLFRMVIGFMFLVHGTASMFGVFGGNRGTGRAVEFLAWPSWWAALIQVVCGGLVMIGLFSRAGATLASGSMAYAYFVVHQPEALLPVQNHGESAALFCWAFFLVAVLGPGPWSLDALVSRAPRGVAQSQKPVGPAPACCATWSPPAWARIRQDAPSPSRCSPLCSAAAGTRICSPQAPPLRQVHLRLRCRLPPRSLLPHHPSLRPRAVIFCKCSRPQASPPPRCSAAQPPSSSSTERQRPLKQPRPRRAHGERRRRTGRAGAQHRRPLPLPS